MKHQTLRAAQRGFTLIELMIVVTLVAVLISLTAPSFTRMLARGKLEGAAGELVTDLQYARSEAVARNAQVAIYTGANCYTVYQVIGAAATGCAALGTGVAIKSVTLADQGITTAATPANTVFEPIRGSSVAGDNRITLTLTAAGSTLSADVKAVGRVKLCTENGFTGVPACT